MKTKLLLVACAFLGKMLYSQSKPTALENWKATVGTQNFFYKNLTKTDPSGFIYVAGATLNVNGKMDILVAKYNADGQQLWVQQYNGSANDVDIATAMYVDANNVYITGASVISTVTPLTSDRIVIKYSSAGVQQWVNLYDGTGHGNDIGSEIIADASGNVYLTGSTTMATADMDFLTQKINATGTTLWTSTDNVNNLTDVGMKMQLSSTLQVSGVGQQSSSDYRWVVYTRNLATGALISSTTGSTSTFIINDVADMAKDALGNIYLCGTTLHPTQGLNWYVVKLNSVGTIQWERSFNGTANLTDMARGIRVDASGSVYVTGYTTTLPQGTNFQTIKYNSTGAFTWGQTYNNINNGNDEAFDLTIDAGNNVYVTGFTTTNLGNTDYYTVKYGSGGAKVWDVTTDGNIALNDKATNIALDANNNVIVTGQSQVNATSNRYLTVKYIQKNVVTPTDFNGETPTAYNWYYPNQGQLRDINDNLISDVKYYTDRTRPGAFIKAAGMSFVMVAGDTIRTNNDTIARVEMNYIGRNQGAETFPMETQKFGLAYLGGIGRDFPSVLANQKLITPNLYPNIDLMYSSNSKGLKYYYIIKPGGDPTLLKIQFSGAASYGLNATTNELSINTIAGNFSFDRPTAYQLSATNALIPLSWTPDWQSNGSTGAYKFATGAYTSSLTLVIEVDRGNTVATPSAIGNLIWNSYQGGNWDDANIDLKLDRFGNIYTLADTWSGTYYLNNTTSLVSPSINKQGALVMRYNYRGERRKQTYISVLSGNLGGSGIGITNDSNVVVTGYTSGPGLSQPTSGNPAGSYTTTVGPSWIMKLNTYMSSSDWSTYYPGSIQDVDCKNNGDIYLCAITRTNTALQVTQPGATNIAGTTLANINSEMVSKFDKNGVALWSTFIGVQPLSGIQPLSHIKVDTTTNEFYVFGVGNGGTQDFTALNSYGTYLKTAPTGLSNDNYIKKFSNTDQMIVSTFMGGNKDEQLFDAVVLKNGDVCFVGTTNSTDTANIIFNPYDGSYVGKKWDNSKKKGWALKFTSRFVWKWGTLYGDSLRNTVFRAATTDNVNSALLIGGYTEGMPNVSYPGAYMKASDALGDAAFLSISPQHIISWATSMGVNSLNERGTSAIQFNYKNKSLNFGGGSNAQNSYPWQPDGNAYYQGSNYAPGHEECTVGRFDAVYITGVNELSLEKLENADIILYPNPSTTSTNLYFKKGIKEAVTIKLYNAIGQEMESRDYKSIDEQTTINVNTSGLSEGIYFINISTSTSRESLKFINFK